MISAGRLRFLALQRLPSASQDALGMRSDNWVDGGYFRCDVRNDSASEQQYADGVAVVRTFELRARWNTVRELALTELHRIFVRGRILRIRSIRNMDEADRVAVIDCEEVT